MALSVVEIGSQSEPDTAEIGSIGIEFPGATPARFLNRVDVAKDASNHWAGLTGLNLSLSTGAYWLAMFDPTDTQIAVTYPPPSPLNAYDGRRFDGRQLAVRIGAADLSLSANGVPEPASWALMLAGFGMLGSALRPRRLANQPVA